MRNKTLITSMVLGLFLTYLVSAEIVSAFWPFDLFDDGRVMGEQTTNVQKKAPGYFQNIMRRLSGQGNKNIKPEPPKQKPSFEEVVNKLVTAGKITSAQGTELLSRLNAIKAKREEVVALQKSLKTWLKSTKLDPQVANEVQEQSAETVSESNETTGTTTGSE